ncbi:MAG: LPS assembly lipoprotein LptE [Pseudomonadota bacterium]
MRYAYMAVLLAMLVTVSGCQWQLRGHNMHLTQYPELIVSAQDTFDPLTVQLIYALKQSGTRIVPDGSTAPRLVLVSSRIEHQSLSYSIEGEVRQEDIRLSLVYRLEEGEKVVIPDTEITQSRELLHQINYDLSDATERQHIIDDLRISLIHQLMLNLSLSHDYKQ